MTELPKFSGGAPADHRNARGLRLPMAATGSEPHEPLPPIRGADRIAAARVSPIQPPGGRHLEVKFPTGSATPPEPPHTSSESSEHNPSEPSRLDKALARRGLTEADRAAMQEKIDWPELLGTPTNSKLKVNFLDGFTTELVPNKNILVRGLGVSSNVNEQPFGPETQTGANNRTDNAVALADSVAAGEASTGDPELDGLIRTKTRGHVGAMENGVVEGEITPDGIKLNLAQTKFDPTKPHFDVAYATVQFPGQERITVVSPPEEAVLIDPADALAAYESGFTLTAGKAMAARLAKEGITVDHQNWHGYVIAQEIAEYKRRVAAGEPTAGLHGPEFAGFDRNEQLTGVLVDAFHELATNQIAEDRTKAAYQETKAVFANFTPKVFGGVVQENKKPRVGNLETTHVEMSFSPRQEEAIIDVTIALIALAKGRTLGNETSQQGTDFATRMLEQLPAEGIPDRDEVSKAFSTATAGLITDLIRERPDLTPAIQAMFRHAGIDGLTIVEMDAMLYYADREAGHEPYRLRQRADDFVERHPIQPNIPPGFAKDFPGYEVHCSAVGLARTLTGYNISVIDELFNPESTRRAQITNPKSFEPGPFNHVDELTNHIDHLAEAVEQRFAVDR